ncbi:MAG: hypothetical protein AB1414_08000 [bacterium]
MKIPKIGFWKILLFFVILFFVGTILMHLPSTQKEEYEIDILLGLTKGDDTSVYSKPEMDSKVNDTLKERTRVLINTKGGKIGYPNYSEEHWFPIRYTTGPKSSMWDVKWGWVKREDIHIPSSSELKDIIPEAFEEWVAGASLEDWVEWIDASVKIMDLNRDGKKDVLVKYIVVNGNHIELTKYVIYNVYQDRVTYIFKAHLASNEGFPEPVIKFTHLDFEETSSLEIVTYQPHNIEMALRLSELHYEICEDGLKSYVIDVEVPGEPLVIKKGFQVYAWNGKSYVERFPSISGWLLYGSIYLQNLSEIFSFISAAPFPLFLVLFATYHHMLSCIGVFLLIVILIATIKRIIKAIYGKKQLSETKNIG